MKKKDFSAVSGVASGRMAAAVPLQYLALSPVYQSPAIKITEDVRTPSSD